MWWGGYIEGGKGKGVEVKVEVVRGILASFDGAFWGDTWMRRYRCELLACGNGTFESEFSMRPIPVLYALAIQNFDPCVPVSLHNIGIWI